MNIKEKIGKRIKEERLNKGLTRKALAELTDTLKISRINNYERGERTPGPEEIKQLAKVLEVSPAFLMCLADDKQGLNKVPNLCGLIPVLDYKQACDPVLHIQEIKNDTSIGQPDFIPIRRSLAARMSENAFALQVKDVSMTPEFRVNDVLIFDPANKPNPGDFVVAKLDSENEAIIRKYKQLSATKSAEQYELIALNDDWANRHIDGNASDKIIGTLICLYRSVK